MMRLRITLLLVAVLHTAGLAQVQPESLGRYVLLARQIMSEALRSQGAWTLLDTLTSQAGSRLSGSTGAATAVALTRRMMITRGFSNVHLEPVTVTHWERGPREDAALLTSRGPNMPLAICALGGSIATAVDGITAEVVEVRNFEELRNLGEKARGKIVFFNRAFDPTFFDTFSAYGAAVDQRSRGAIEAARAGGVAVLVRSMTSADDNVPHTGTMSYVDSVQKIPGAAIGIRDANLLSRLLGQGLQVRVRFSLTCRTLPDAPSANVLGEITGSTKPDEVIIVGGHLDCWDKGTGAHDDGAGCAQAIEALRLIKQLGLTPKRTIRAVMFMNEENGMAGGLAYAASTARTVEKHLAGIESDRGGFAPRGFTVQADSAAFLNILRWRPVFAQYRAGEIEQGGSGVDVSPMVRKGMAGLGLNVESHRYFDYHHSANDTIDKVNARELEIGAAVLAVMCYILSEEGI